MPVLPRTTTARAVVVAAICGAWVASCSSDVDQFHLAESLGGGGDGATSGASGGGEAGATGNAGGSAGASAASNAGGSGGSNAGGHFGTQSRLDGGLESGAGGVTDASVESGAGAGGVVIGAGGGGGAGGTGAGGIGSGGTSAGGAGSGGTGSGGIGSGGAGAGGAGAGGAGAGGKTGSGGAGNGGAGAGGTGSGGTGAGGAGAGGTGSGGAGAGGKTGSGGAGSGGAGAGGTGSGGTGSGGTGSGGAGTGGSGSGGTGSGGTGAGGLGDGGAGSGGASSGGASGTWPGDPVVKALDTTVSGITAAAWEPTSKHFFLLASAAHEFYELDPSAAPKGHITGPVSISATTLYTRPFGASASTIYVVADGTIRRLGHNGTLASSVALSITPTIDAQLTGGYAGGWFFVGNTNGAAQAVQDASSTLDSGAKALTGVHGVSTDGQSFAFIVSGGVSAAAHRVAPGAFTLNATPCNIGSFSTSSSDPLGVFGTTIAWVSTSSGQPYTLHVAPLPGGVCGAVNTVGFGQPTTGSQAVGLLDDEYALVTTNVFGGNVTMAIEDSLGGPESKPTGGTNAGSGTPIAFVMGTDAPTHYAVLVTKDRPILVSF